MFNRKKNPLATPASQATALAVTASPADRAQLERIFVRAGWRVVFADTVAAAGTDGPRIVILDRDLPGVEIGRAHV